MKFSPSMIQTWMKCGLQAKYKYVDKLEEKGTNAAAEYGTAIHASLEHFNITGKEDEALEMFNTYWEQVIVDPEVRLPARTTFASYRDKGFKMLNGYFEARKWADDIVIGQEVRFHVPFGRHTISGIVDKVSVIPGETLKVTDYKTGYRPNATNLGQNIQFTSYLYAAQQKEFWVGEEGSDKYVGFPNGEQLFEEYSKLNFEGVWLDLRNGKEYNVGPRGTADYVRLHRCLDQIELAMEKQVFVPDISGDTCTFCAFQDRCPSYLDEDQQGTDVKLTV